MAGTSDYKMGVIVNTDKCPRVNVRMLIYGKQETPHIHISNLSLLYHDPPDQKKIEIMADNQARKQAAEKDSKVWDDMPGNLKNA